MIYASIALFALAAVFGATILFKWLNSKDPPRLVVYTHGLFAIIAYIILIAYSVNNPDHFPKVSLILFGIAAIAGLYMFIGDMQKKPHPMVVAFIHAFVTITSFILLLMFVFG